MVRRAIVRSTRLRLPKLRSSNKVALECQMVLQPSSTWALLAMVMHQVREAVDRGMNSGDWMESRSRLAATGKYEANLSIEEESMLLALPAKIRAQKVIWL